MLRNLLIVFVGLVAVAAYGLAWLSRSQRAAVLVFGGVGSLYAVLVGAAFLHSDSWLTVTLLIAGGLGVLAILWAILMASSIARGINSMVVRDVPVGQPFSLSGAARVARVGALTLRYDGIEMLDDGGYRVRLKATVKPAQSGPSAVSLEKMPDRPGAEVALGRHRLTLIDVTNEGNKASLYTARLLVTEQE